MRRMVERLGALALVAVTGLGVLAGCGGEAAQEAAERSPDPVIAAAGTAADEETAVITMSVSFSGVPDTLTVEGPVDLIDGDEAQFTLTAEAQGQQQQLEARLVDGETYVQNPAPAPDQPAWFRVPQGQQAVEGAAGSVTDPVQAIEMLDSIVDTEEAGTTEVDGEEMTVQKGRIDLSEAAGSEQEQNQLAAMGLTEVPVEVAIDDQGRLRRVTVTADLSQVAAQAGGQNPGAQNPGTMTIVVELSDFGTSLDVQAPPPDQVGDLPTGGLGAAGEGQTATA